MEINLYFLFFNKSYNFWANLKLLLRISWQTTDSILYFVHGGSLRQQYWWVSAKNPPDLSMRRQNSDFQCNNLFFHRIIECFGWERTFRGHLAQSPCSEQGHLQPDHVAQSPIQPGLKCSQGWAISHCSGQPVPGFHHPQCKNFQSKSTDGAKQICSAANLLCNNTSTSITLQLSYHQITKCDNKSI